MTYSTKWYTAVHNIKGMSRPHLTALMRKYKTQLDEIGITIPDSPIVPGEEEKSDQLFYQQMADIFATPERLPDELHEALYYIHDMDCESGHVQITQAAMMGELHIDMTQSLTRADFAILAWLDNEETLKALHLNVTLEKTKSYISMQPTLNPKPVPVAFASVRVLIERDLDAVFASRSRGRASQVQMHSKDGELRYVITHGEPFRRDGCREDEKSASVFYRPETTDVVVFNPEYGDLRMNVYAKWHKELYRDVFERHLFAGTAGFKEEPRYNLEPLRTRGRAALETTNEAILCIRLSEIEFEVDEAHGDTITRTAEDVFAAYERDAASDPAKGFPSAYRIARASFKIRFANSKKERSVVIQPPNRARYLRDEDSKHIEAWLREHGMIIVKEGVTHEAA